MDTAHVLRILSNSCFVKVLGGDVEQLVEVDVGEPVAQLAKECDLFLA